MEALAVTEPLSDIVALAEVDIVEETEYDMLVLHDVVSDIETVFDTVGVGGGVIVDVIVNDVLGLTDRDNVVVMEFEVLDEAVEDSVCEDDSLSEPESDLLSLRDSEKDPLDEYDKDTDDDAVVDDENVCDVDPDSEVDSEMDADPDIEPDDVCDSDKL
jgi:hypothetical protein